MSDCNFHLVGHLILIRMLTLLYVKLEPVCESSFISWCEEYPLLLTAVYSEGFLFQVSHVLMKLLANAFLLIADFDVVCS